jgi:signal transduction histidine kinase
VGVIILLTLYDPLKDRLESKVVELFFRERNRLTVVLDDLATRMQHGILDPSRMATIVVDTLHAARRATHAAVYLLDPSGDGFARHAHRGPEPARRVNANELPALWQAIQQSRSPLLADQLAEEDASAEEPAHRDLIEAMRAASGDLIFPFVSGEEVLGFLALRDDRSAEPYATKEVAQLMKIADTAATVIWNSKLAERLRERERLAAIGAMAAGLAHEIRNPLGAIKGAAEYLDPQDGPADPELLGVIIEEVNRLNTVVSQFLDYARPFRACFTRVDLNDVLRKTSRLIAAQRSEPALELDLEAELPSIEADGEQLKQVILNLVLNALDASKDAEAPVRVETRHLRGRRMVELKVRDSGEGIPRENLEQIFIPFFTTKQQGTGLGLAVCHRIVMSHGGTIHPESEVGQGTDFVIRLPIEQRPEGPSPLLASDLGAEPAARERAGNEV